jgi:glyoxylase-like metal-dependent hydrolase (beta-lactamase superfamily II)
MNMDKAISVFTTMTNIDEDVYQFAGMRSGQAYMLKDKEGTVLIDTGMQGDFKKIKSQIEGSGLSVGDIHTNILTHWHADHCANAERGWGRYSLECSNFK